MFTVPRRVATAAQFVLDQLVPPIVRDSSWFMRLPMRLVLGRHTSRYMSFKDDVFTYTDEEFANLYRSVDTGSSLHGDTDLNQRCIDEILGNLIEGSVLEVGCGRGFLAERIAQTGRPVTACDIVVPDGVRERYLGVEFHECFADDLPFADGSFDAVVCTHVLEHVQDLHGVVAELRRVARRQVIIVVPRQRPYRYTFSLHIHFFPYRWSIESAFGADDRTRIVDLDDWYYEQTLTE